MNKLFTPAALLILAVSFAPAVFAADAGKAFSDCKSQAESEEVADADMKIFISNCMQEMEVAAADIQSLVDKEFSDGKPADKEGKDD